MFKDCTQEQIDQKAFRLVGHVRAVGRKIKENCNFIIENEVIPVKRLNEVYKEQSELASLMQYLNGLGAMMFTPEEWEKYNKSRIIGLNGHNLDLDDR